MLGAPHATPSIGPIRTVNSHCADIVTSFILYKSHDLCCLKTTECRNTAAIATTAVDTILHIFSGLHQYAVRPTIIRTITTNLGNSLLDLSSSCRVTIPCAINPLGSSERKGPLAPSGNFATLVMAAPVRKV